MNEHKVESSDRYARYRQRQKLRGVDRLHMYIKPENKQRLSEMAKREGSYDAAIEKLFASHQNQQDQAA